MKNIVAVAFSICLSFPFQGCNQSATNQQIETTTNTSFIEKEETNANTKDTITIELEKKAKDTTINIKDKQIYVKIEIAAIQGKFIIQKSFGDYGKVYITKMPDTEIDIQISNCHYKLQKQDIPKLDNMFLNMSVFQNVKILSVTEQLSTFEITLGELDTDNIVFVILTIDSNGNKSFKLEHPEWEDEE